MPSNWAGNVNKALNIRVAERRQLALQLRATGLHYRDICDQMKAAMDDLPSTYDERFVYRDIKHEMNRLRTETMETANDIRIFELELLNKLQTSVLPKALMGDLKAVDKVLKIMGMRAQYLGLFAPSSTKVEVNDWRMEIINMIKTGAVTRQQAEEEFGSELITQLLDTGSANVIEGSFAEEKGSRE